MVRAAFPEVRNLAIKTSANVKWHVIASIALSGCNAPKEVSQVLQYALQTEANDDIKGETARTIARETREGIFKAAQLMYVA